MKQALTETLAYFDENDQAFRMSDLRIYVAAARLVERLLPGECGSCEGTGGGQAWGSVVCPSCHAGLVWDEGIVEAVAKVLNQVRERVVFRPEEDAHAVLSVIAELLAEKVK